MSLNEQIAAAVGAHGLWKGRLRAAIESGRTDVPVESVRDDHRCAFGKWLYGTEIGADVKKSKDYSVCTDLHKRFHKAAADVLSLAVAGKKDEASQAMGAEREFGKVSIELTKAMMAWKAR